MRFRCQDEFACESSIARNHWASPDAECWDLDPVWDRCLIKLSSLKGRPLEEYISQYYNQHYGLAEDLDDKHKSQVKLVKLPCLNSIDGRKNRLLSACPEPLGLQRSYK